MKKKLQKILIKVYPDGVSFWYGKPERWILDASTFKEDGHITLNADPDLGLVFELVRLNSDKIELQLTTPKKGKT